MEIRVINVLATIMVCSITDMADFIGAWVFMRTFRLGEVNVQTDLKFAGTGNTRTTCSSVVIHIRRRKIFNSESDTVMLFRTRINACFKN